MRFVVEACGDDELPEGVHIVIVEKAEEPHVMFVNGPVLASFALCRSWQASQVAPGEPTVLYEKAPEKPRVPARWLAAV